MSLRFYPPALLATLVAVSVFGLMFSACSTPDGALDPPSSQNTMTSVPSATSTTAVSPTTSGTPELTSVTPNAGDLRVIVLGDAEGELPHGTLIECGGQTFPVAALDSAPFLAAIGLPEVEEGIRSFLESAEGAFWPQEEWRGLDRRDEYVLLVHTGLTKAGPTVAFMEVEKVGGEWRWAGSSMGEGCPLEVVASGLGTVDWRLDPSAPPLTPESTVIHVLVTGEQCSGGQPVGERLRGPQVIVTDAEVLIAFAAQPLSGVHTCPGNPEELVTIELSGPIGDRVVTDGLALGKSLEDVLRP